MYFRREAICCYFSFLIFPFYVNFYFSLPKSKPLNGKDEDFSLFIKSGHVQYFFPVLFIPV